MSLFKHSIDLGFSLDQIKSLNRMLGDVDVNITSLANVTAGTVAASKAVVVNATKDIGDFRNLDAVNVDAGASGTAGTVDVFPSTAAKGKLALTAADSAGDTTTTIVNASQSGARTYTIPDAGASASFVMTAGTQTVAGQKTLSTGASSPSLQVTGQSVTATVGGGTTGLIPAGASFVTVTSDNADKQISLPAGTVGDVIRIQVGATACELIAVTAADKVNNVVVGTTNEAALVATSTYTCQYVAANTWVVTGITNLGAHAAALVPDAL